MVGNGRGGVRCREEGCGYEFQPRMDRPLRKILGSRPGDVELCTLKFEGSKDFPVGMTLNNAPHLYGRKLTMFRGVMRSMKNHYVRHHPGVRPAFLYKVKGGMFKSDRIARGLLMQRARTARYKERKAWDRDFLVQRGISMYKIKHPLDTEPSASLAPICDVNFLPWVTRLSVEPVSTAMIMGDEPWVFQFPPWRKIHEFLVGKAERSVLGAWNAVSKCFSAAIMQTGKHDQDGGFDDKMLCMLYECFLCQRNIILSDEHLHKNVHMPTFVINNIIQCARTQGVGYIGDLYRVELAEEWEARCKQWMLDAEEYATKYADEQMVKQGARFLTYGSNTSVDEPPNDI